MTDRSDDDRRPPDLVEPPAPERVTPPVAPAPAAVPVTSSPPDLVEPPSDHPAPTDPAPTEPADLSALLADTEPADLRELRGMGDAAEPPPTEPAAVLPPSGEAYPGAPPGPSAAEFLGFVPLGTGQSALPSARATPPDQLDELFGAERFQDYTPPPRYEPVAFGVAVPADQAVTRGFSPSQRTLLWVVGCVIAVLALVVVFLIGTRLASAGPAAAPPASTPPPTEPAPPAVPTGPVEPGEHPWDELVGGECIDGFVDAWAPTFEVVDCAESHDAQLVLRTAVPPDPSTPTTDTAAYPGATVLAPRVTGWCSASGVVDLAAAGELTDVLVTGSYPLEEEWDAGARDYRCFVLRADDAPLLGSLIGTAQEADWAARRAAATAPPAQTSG